MGRGRTKRSIPHLISLDETLDLGVDAGTPVTDDYAGRGNEVNGAIHWVQIDLGLDDHAHLADPSQRAQVALTRQ